MGDIRRLPMKTWAETYGLNTFVETGVDGGAAIIAALSRGYEIARSIEIVPRQVERAARNISLAHPKKGHRWEIILGDSVEELPELLRSDLFQTPATRVLWWLDAHFPERYQNGADKKVFEGVDHGDFGTRLPLREEVIALTTGRDISRDVIVIDDWRVYEEIPNNSGPLPIFLRDGAGGLPAPTHGAEILKALSVTHNVRLDVRDGGYLVCLPR